MQICLRRLQASKLLKLKFSFGGGHSDHHAVAVTLNREQQWISNENGQFAGLMGFKDLNYHPHHDDTNPYQHIANAPFFS